MKINTECNSCEGLGKRDVAKCSGCEGRGFKVTIQQFAPGMMAQSRNTCNDCGGKGKSGSGDDCTNCEGKKSIDKIISVDFEFSSGVQHDYMIQRTIDDIDFIFVAKVEDHSIYKRKGNDLEITKDINLFESLMGIKFNLKLLSGKDITIKSKNGNVIKPNTQYILKGLGINGKDLHINFNIIFPDKVLITGKKILSEILNMDSQYNDDKEGEIVFI
jgi:DnaJ family protein A protein 2